MSVKPSQFNYPLPFCNVILSVVMPCHNEANHIEATLREWANHLEELSGQTEIIVVNDGSTDGTGRILDRLRKELSILRVVHQLRAGHDKAVRRGYEMVRGRYVLQVDPNGRYDPYDFNPVWDLRNSHRLIIGRRTHRIDSLVRRYFSRLVGYLVNFMFKCPLAEPNLPFRLYQKETLVLYLSQLQSSIESVNLALAIMIQRTHPESTAEIPVPFRFRHPSRKRMHITTFMGFMLHTVIELVHLRWSLLKIHIPSGSLDSPPAPA